MSEVYTRPATSGEAIDISGTDHTTTSTTRALWVGTAGNVKVDMVGGEGPGETVDTITFTNVQNGTLLPIAVTKVYKTGTTASDMNAVW